MLELLRCAIVQGKSKKRKSYLRICSCSSASASRSDTMHNFSFDNVTNWIKILPTHFTIHEMKVNCVWNSLITPFEYECYKGWEHTPAQRYLD